MSADTNAPTSGSARPAATRQRRYFKKPALGCLAKGVKTWDLRLGDPFEVGSEYLGVEGAFQQPFVVQSAIHFETVPLMAHWAITHGYLSQLFPDEWLYYSHLQRSSSDHQRSSSDLQRSSSNLQRSSGDLHCSPGLSSAVGDKTYPQAAGVLPGMSSSPSLPHTSTLATRRRQLFDVQSVVEFYSACLGRRAFGPCTVYSVAAVGEVVLPRYMSLLTDRPEEQPSALSAEPASTPPLVSSEPASTPPLVSSEPLSAGDVDQPLSLVGVPHSRGALDMRFNTTNILPSPFVRESYSRDWCQPEATEPELDNSLSPHSTVYVLVCSHHKGSVRILASREAEATELSHASYTVPSRRMQPGVDSSTGSVASALASDILANFTLAVDELATGRATHRHVDLVSRHVHVYAIGASSLPMGPKGSWVWVPPDHALLSIPHADKAALQAAARSWRQRQAAPAPTTPSMPYHIPHVRHGTRAQRRRRGTSALSRPRADCSTPCQMGTSQPAEQLLQSGRGCKAAMAAEEAAVSLRRTQPLKSGLTLSKGSGPPPQTGDAMVAALVMGTRGLTEHAQATVDQSMMEKLVAQSRTRARARGADTVTVRDIAEAARSMDTARGKTLSPAEVLPEHYEQLLQQLVEIRKRVDRAVAEGAHRPRVLVACERHSVVAKMFQEAGADVATCDLYDTDTKGIPHFKGDASRIVDMGWDLVIGHPPCTYLANVGVSALHKDPARCTPMERSADFFRRIYNADAPFVAIENPVMHRRGRDRVASGPPTQYIQPYQHGTPHQKRTGLHLRNLPPLVPTCEVAGRERPMANLPETPDRSDHRSRTYVGIAGAMAVQWLPCVLDYARELAAPERTGSRLDAATMVQMARELQENHRSVVWYSTTGADGCARIFVPRNTTQPMQCKLQGKDGGSLAACAVRALAKASVPSTWTRAAAEVLRAYPTGHRQRSVLSITDPTGQGLTGEDVATATTTSAWLVTLDPDTAATTSAGEWKLLTEVLKGPRSTGDDALLHGCLADQELAGDTVAYAAEARVAELAKLPKLPSTFQPWLHPPEYTKDIYLRPAPTRVVKYRHGHWSAWSAVPDSDPPRYKWKRLPPSLETDLDTVCRPQELSTIGRRFDLRAVGIEEKNMENGDWTEVLNGQPSAEIKSELPTVAAVISHFQLNPESAKLHEELREFWTRSEKLASGPKHKDRHKQLSRPGLGAEDPQTPPAHGYRAAQYTKSNHDRKRLADALRVEYPQRFVSGSILNGARSHKPREALEQAQPKEPVSDTVAIVAESTPVTRDLADVMDTPTTTRPRYNNCLLLRNVTVCRKARDKVVDRYWVDKVLTDVSRTLPDTGATPSVVTTQLLAQFPSDALVSREREQVDRVIEGPDGSPLALQGHATIVFDIDGHTYRHRFLVAEGRPLMILGNDFLAPWQAKFSLNEDGTGRGVLTLGEQQYAITSNSADLVSYVAPTSANVAPAQVPRLDGSVAIKPKAKKSEQPPNPVPIHKASEVTGLSPQEIISRQLVLVEGSHMLFSRDSITLPPMTKVVSYLQAPHAVVKQGLAGIVGPLPHQLNPAGKAPDVELSAGVPDEDGLVKVVLWNRSRAHKTVPRFSPAASFDTECVIHERHDPARPVACYADLQPDQQEMVDKIQIDPQKRLTPAQIQAVKDLVAEFIDVFAKDTKDPSRTHLLEVELELKPDVRPHRHAPSRLGPEGQKIVDQHVDEMESRNIIRKSNSAWGSRVVLVTKKDGSIRFCVDFRDTNSKLQVMDSPIPLTAEAIDRLASGQGDPSSLFLSTLDLASGFWCLPIREQDKALTSFVTHRGKYEFNYLPFGIQSGPSYMCRLMDSALQGLAWDICMPYLDDCATWSTGTGADEAARELSSYDQMMHRLRLIFERFRWAQLSCSPKKCELFATSAAYLGHVVSRQGLEMDPKKIAAIRSIDTTNINDLGRVRSFLGLCSYYRRFIRHFATIAAPLHDLTKDGVDVPVLSQSAPAQAAMRALIDALCSEPILAMPKFDRPSIVKTDAAIKEGIGGILSQKDDDGKEHVNAYYGRRLRKAETNWTVTEVELLAALESITNWRPYLWGREFTLVVDHSALRWLHTMRDSFEGGPGSRLMRWIMKLQEYRFTVQHKPGLIHQDADGVSRLVDLVAAALASRDAAGRPLSVAACVECRSQLREWADKLQPSGAEYAAARDSIIAEFWAAADKSPHTVAAATDIKGTVTARKLQDRERRLRNQSESRSNIIHYYLDTGAPTQQRTRDAQQQDEECRYLTDLLVSGSVGNPTTLAEWKRAQWGLREARHLRIEDGILYRVDPRQDPQRSSRLYVPTELRPLMLTAFHDHIGHQAHRSMRGAISPRYYWPGMDRDIATYVSECHECTLAKRLARRDRRSRGPKHGHYPFDTLYVDVLDMAKTHDFKAGGAGFDKLLVFVDSLTRWVEAVPFNGDPSSEQVLDAFMTHIVARHGCPRVLRSDRGGNVSSDLCDTILAQTGCQLRPSTAEHHESVGTVERFNDTLSGMVRAADEGGLHWVDHLPFLLMSYRATPHRVTQHSPAALLYGRELRLPAQMAHPGPTGDSAARVDAPPAVRDYAIRLHNNCVWAWQIASQFYAQEQSAAASTTTAKSTVYSYQVNDSVARLLPGHDNKLKYLYSGPYRVEAVLPDGRFRLRDLENRILHDEFDGSHLRPYRTIVDAEELASDEYIIDYIHGHRDRRGAREFFIKWRGYPKSASTWEPRIEIERRATSLVETYESSLAAAPAPVPAAPALAPRSRAVRQPRLRHPSAVAAQPRPPYPPAVAAPPPPVPTQPPPAHGQVSDSEPSEASFSRGTWSYGRRIATPRGFRLQWYPATHFLPSELSSATFSGLRQAWTSKQTPVVVAAVTALADGWPMQKTPSVVSDAPQPSLNVHAPTFVPQSSAEVVPSPSVATAAEQPAQLGSVSTAAKQPSPRWGDDDPDSKNDAVAEPPPKEYRASKVWFLRQRPDNPPELMVFHRADSSMEKPQYDTFGGRMDPQDDNQAHRCALRELREEVGLVEPLRSCLAEMLSAFPDGQSEVTLTKRSDNTRHRVALWLVNLPEGKASSRLPRPTAEGLREMRVKSFAWQPVQTVVSNLQTFWFARPMATRLRQMVAEETGSGDSKDAVSQPTGGRGLGELTLRRPPSSRGKGGKGQVPGPPLSAPPPSPPPSPPDSDEDDAGPQEPAPFSIPEVLEIILGKLSAEQRDPDMGDERHRRAQQAFMWCAAVNKAFYAAHIASGPLVIGLPLGSVHDGLFCKQICILPLRRLPVSESVHQIEPLIRLVGSYAMYYANHDERFNASYTWTGPMRLAFSRAWSVRGVQNSLMVNPANEPAVLSTFFSYHWFLSIFGSQFAREDFCETTTIMRLLRRNEPATVCRGQTSILHGRAMKTVVVPDETRCAILALVAAAKQDTISVPIWTMWKQGDNLCPGHPEEEDVPIIFTAHAMVTICYNARGSVANRVIIGHAQLTGIHIHVSESHRPRAVVRKVVLRLRGKGKDKEETWAQASVVHLTGAALAKRNRELGLIRVSFETYGHTKAGQRVYHPNITLGDDFWGSHPSLVHHTNPRRSWISPSSGTLHILPEGAEIHKAARYAPLVEALEQAITAYRWQQLNTTVSEPYRDGVVERTLYREYWPTSEEGYVEITLRYEPKEEDDVYELSDQGLRRIYRRREPCRCHLRGPEGVLAGPEAPVCWRCDVPVANEALDAFLVWDWKREAVQRRNDRLPATARRTALQVIRRPLNYRGLGVVTCANMRLYRRVPSVPLYRKIPGELTAVTLGFKTFRFTLTPDRCVGGIQFGLIHGIYPASSCLLLLVQQVSWIVWWANEQPAYLLEKPHLRRHYDLGVEAIIELATQRLHDLRHNPEPPRYNTIAGTQRYPRSLADGLASLEIGDPDFGIRPTSIRDHFEIMPFTVWVRVFEIMPTESIRPAFGQRWLDHGPHRPRAQVTSWLYRLDATERNLWRTHPGLIGCTPRNSRLCTIDNIMLGGVEPGAAPNPLAWPMSMSQTIYDIIMSGRQSPEARAFTPAPTRAGRPMFGGQRTAFTPGCALLLILQRVHRRAERD